MQTTGRKWRKSWSTWNGSPKRRNDEEFVEQFLLSYDEIYFQ